MPVHGATHAVPESPSHLTFAACGNTPGLLTPAACLPGGPASARWRAGSGDLPMIGRPAGDAAAAGHAAAGSVTPSAGRANPVRRICTFTSFDGPFERSPTMWPAGCSQRSSLSPRPPHTPCSGHDPSDVDERTRYPSRHGRATGRAETTPGEQRIFVYVTPSVPVASSSSQRRSWTRPWPSTPCFGAGPAAVSLTARLKARSDSMGTQRARHLTTSAQPGSPGCGNTPAEPASAKARTSSTAGWPPDGNDYAGLDGVRPGHGRMGGQLVDGLLLLTAGGRSCDRRRSRARPVALRCKGCDPTTPRTPAAWLASCSSVLQRTAGRSGPWQPAQGSVSEQFGPGRPQSMCQPFYGS